MLSLDIFDTKPAHTNVYKCDAVNDVLRPVLQLSLSKCRYGNYVIECFLRGLLKKQSYMLAGKILQLIRLSC